MLWKIAHALNPLIGQLQYKMKKLEIIFISLLTVIFVSIFFLIATVEGPPLATPFKLLHWHRTKTMPHKAICGNDTISLSDQMVIESVKRNLSNNSYIVMGWSETRANEYH